MKFKYCTGNEFELEVPYYFYSSDSTLNYKTVGKITDTKVSIIHFEGFPTGRDVIISNHDIIEATIPYSIIRHSKSTEEKFEQAKKEALEFLQ